MGQGLVVNTGMLLRAALISQETSRSEQTYAPVHGPTPMPKGAELNVLGGRERRGLREESGKGDRRGLKTGGLNLG